MTKTKKSIYTTIIICVLVYSFILPALLQNSYRLQKIERDENLRQMEQYIKEVSNAHENTFKISEEI